MQIEAAHAELNRVGAKPGPLAVRCVEALAGVPNLIARLDSDPRTVAEWVDCERTSLWGDLVWAIKWAAKRPDPNDRSTWSITMEGLAERIVDASRLLGGPTQWLNIGWDAWLFYPLIENVPLPHEAWEWLETWIANQLDGASVEGAVRVLRLRPSDGS